MARNLFGDEDPLDQIVRVRNVPFRVIGVMAPKGQSAFGQDQDDVIFVPLDAGRRRVIGRNYAKDRSVGSIFVKFADEEDIAPGIEQHDAAAAPAPPGRRRPGGRFLDPQPDRDRQHGLGLGQHAVACCSPRSPPCRSSSAASAS